MRQLFPAGMHPIHLGCRKSSPTSHKHHLQVHSLRNKTDSLGLTPAALSQSSGAACWCLSVTSLLKVASPAAAENASETGHCKLSFSLQ